MPVGQVSRWHWRAMSQPSATSAAVPKAYSSAPRSAATSRSRPVWRPPSVRSATRSRRSFRSRTWWTSARPSSHGAPACLIELIGAGEVRGRNTEAGRGYLLDEGVATAAVGGRLVPCRILATLARVRRAAGALDADRQRLVGFGAEGADAHGGDDEAPNNGS